MKRRDFLKAALAAGATFGFPTIVPASVLGKGPRPAPSNRIVLAAAGMNWMGMGNLNSFLSKDDAQVVAVCDVDKNHLQNAKNAVDGKYQNSDCVTYHDFREMISRGDLDGVFLALPDHWHAIPAIMAMQAGLDVYGEKPLSHSLYEGRAMANTAKRFGRIWQTGSWQRSTANFHQAVELVHTGRIGKIKYIEVGLGGGHPDFDGIADKTQIIEPPASLDYDFWLGPAPYAPYCEARIHKNWRWIQDYGGGMLMDWVGHHLDIAHWSMGYDNTGPIEVEATGDHPTGLYNTSKEFEVHTKYADGVTMKIVSGGQHGTKWFGEDGKWVHVDRGFLEANPSSLLQEVIGPEEDRVYKSTDHQRNFLDCMRSRHQTITPCEAAHRSASVGHLGNISIKLGRKLRWDPKAEKFVNDVEADNLLMRAYRSPWRLEV